jgi:thiamine pyrophosphokinase
MKNKILTISAIVLVALGFSFLCLRVYGITTPTLDQQLQSEIKGLQKDWKDWDYQQKQGETIVNNSVNKKLEIEKRSNAIRVLLGSFQ